jgi:hypothetical protein
MHILNTKKIIADAARAEITRLKRRQKILEERRRVLEQLIREQQQKTTESQ